MTINNLPVYHCDLRLLNLDYQITNYHLQIIIFNHKLSLLKLVIVG